MFFKKKSTCTQIKKLLNTFTLFEGSSLAGCCLFLKEPLGRTESIPALSSSLPFLFSTFYAQSEHVLG